MVRIVSAGGVVQRGATAPLLSVGPGVLAGEVATPAVGPVWCTAGRAGGGRGSCTVWDGRWPFAWPRDGREWGPEDVPAQDREPAGVPPAGGVCAGGQRPRHGE